VVLSAAQRFLRPGRQSLLDLVKIRIDEPFGSQIAHIRWTLRYQNRQLKPDTITDVDSKQAQEDFKKAVEAFFLKATESGRDFDVVCLKSEYAKISGQVDEVKATLLTTQQKDTKPFQSTALSLFKTKSTEFISLLRDDRNTSIFDGIHQYQVTGANLPAINITSQTRQFHDWNRLEGAVSKVRSESDVAYFISLMLVLSVGILLITTALTIQQINRERCRKKSREHICSLEAASY